MSLKGEIAYIRCYFLCTLWIFAFLFECRQALGIIEQFSTYIVSLGRFYIYLSRNFKHNEL